MAQDQEELVRKRLRAALGKLEADSAVTPGPVDDPEAAVRARLRSEFVTQELTKPTKANPQGMVLETPGWGVGSAIANGMAGGYLPQMLAIPQSGGLLEGGGVPDEGFNARYEQNVNDLQGRRVDYNKENPWKSLVAETGGNLATTVPLMAAGAGAIAPVGSAIAKTAPWASSVVDFLSGAGKFAKGIPSLAARGAAEGAESAMLSSGLSDKPIGEQGVTGAIVGAPLGVVGGKIAQQFGSHINKTSAESAQALIDSGVPVQAGQIPGANKAAQAAYKVFGGNSGTAQREAFGEKLTSHAGMPEKEVSQGWVTKNDARIGQIRKDIQANYSIPAGGDTDLALGLANARLEAHRTISDPDKLSKVNKFLDKVDENIANGVNGDRYADITKRGGLIDNFARDEGLKHFAGSVRSTLDDAWGRFLPADKKAAWDQANREYKITRAIDDSIGKTGPSQGIYDPKKLFAAVEKSFGNVDKAGELGLLARGGQFLESPGATPAGGSPVKKFIEKGMLLGGAGGAVAAGAHVYNHVSPAMIMNAAQHPEGYALPLAGILGALGIGYGAHRAVNSPRATQHILDISSGSRNPLFMGNNPLIPLLVEGYNKRSNGPTQPNE